jgi:hypothetical protein
MWQRTKCDLQRHTFTPHGKQYTRPASRRPAPLLAPMLERRGRPSPHPGCGKGVRRSAIIATISLIEE